MSGIFEFQSDAAGLPGTQVALYFDGALRNENVSPDLITAMPAVSATSAPTGPQREAILQSDGKYHGSDRDSGDWSWRAR